MRDFMRSTSILARGGIDNRASRRAAFVACPETPPGQRASPVWCDTSATRPSAFGQRARERNGLMVHQKDSSVRDHNVEYRCRLLDSDGQHAPLPAACYVPSQRFPPRCIAVAAHPNPDDTSQPTRFPFAPLSHAVLSYFCCTPDHLDSTIAAVGCLVIRQRAWS
jgi:hypothetical protein